MLCGLPDIDIEDMKENTEYHSYGKDDKVIQWLWELLESYDKSKRAAFLQFVTGICCKILLYKQAHQKYLWEVSKN